MNERKHLQHLKMQTETGEMILIGDPVGSGGTALVYSGEELIDGQESVRILLKELYPDSEGIVRNPDGKIEGNNIRSRQLYDRLADSLQEEQELGNKIAKAGVPGVYPMNRVVRDRKTGNYYGLFYQCPPSMSLKQVVECAGDRMSLSGKIRLIRSLSRTVEILHEKGGYCHNDISGGNVLVMGNILPKDADLFTDWAAMEQGIYAGLIDFACAAKLDWNGTAKISWDEEDMRFHTDGFSAPELYDSDGSTRTLAMDIYSTAACLWYLLTGTRLRTGEGQYFPDAGQWEMFEQCVRSHELCALSGDIRAAFGRNPNPVPEDVVKRLRHLLERGLAKSDERYVRMETFTERLDEILALIEGASVSETVLADRVRKAFEKTRGIHRNDYTIRDLMLPMAQDEERSCPLMECLESGESVYVIGAGGIGKTTSLFRLAENLFGKKRAVVPVYIEMNQLPMRAPADARSPREYWLGKDGRPMFLEQYLAGIYYGCPGQLTDRDDFTAGALRRQMERRTVDGPGYLILLDGLNEMAFSDSEEKRAFMEAINWYLANGRNLRMVLTSRYDEALVDPALARRVRVTGLSDEAVLCCLTEEKESGRLPEKEYEKVTRLDRTSNLWKCLRLPLFLMMYCDIEEKEEISSAGEILKQFFHDKKEAVDGKHGYSERLLGEEKYRGRMFTDGLSMDLARRLVVDFVLPEIGFDMVNRQVFFVEKEAACERVGGYLQAEGHHPAVIRRYGYRTDMQEAQRRLREAGAEKILDDICVRMGVFLKNSEGGYFFPHQYYRDYFAALAILNRFEETVADVAEYEELVKRKESGQKQENCPNHLLMRAADRMEFLDRTRLPESVLMICGECLGIHHTAPVYDGERWIQPKKWDPLFDRVLDLYRGRKGNVFKKYVIDKQKQAITLLADSVDEDEWIVKWFSERMRAEREETGKGKYAEANLVEILRLCRRHHSRADLSGVDLSYIRLSAARLEDTILSHPKGESGLYANLSWTGLGTDGFRRRRRRKDTDMEENHIYLAPDGAWMLAVSESGGRSYIEEREVLGEEVRPLGYWGERKAHVYREDGRVLCLIDEQDRVEGKANILHFYDRKTGRTLSIKLPAGEILEYQWCKDAMVVITSSVFKVEKHIIREENGTLTKKTCELKDVGPGIWERYRILDTERILIMNHRGTAVLTMEAEEKQKLDTFQTGYVSAAAIDSKRELAYLANERGQLLILDWRRGKTDVADEHEIWSFVRWMEISGNGLLVYAEGSLYEWNRKDQSLRLIKYFREQKEKTFCLTIGGMYGATDDGMVFRLSDGKTMKVPDERKEEKEGKFLSWVSPKEEEVRLSVLDIDKQVLYHYYLDEFQVLLCSGYMFPELETPFVTAFYPDWKNQRLMVCDHEKIRFYDLNTGEWLKDMKDIRLPDGILERNMRGHETDESLRCFIKSAAFAPGGKSLEIRVEYRSEKMFPFYSEDAWFQWNIETGTAMERPLKDDGERIETYMFDLGDILSGIDHGIRHPVKVYSETEEEFEARMEREEEMDYDLYSSIFPSRKAASDLVTERKGGFGVSGKMKEFFSGIGRKREKVRGRIKTPIFFDGKSCGGVGTEGNMDEYREEYSDFIFLDGEKGTMVCYQNVLSKDMLATGELIPFEGGFLIRRGLEIRRYIIGAKKISEKGLPYVSEYLMLGCLGAEEAEE